MTADWAKPALERADERGLCPWARGPLLRRAAAAVTGSLSPQLVTREDPRALAAALSWGLGKTEAVQQACCQELSLRLQQVQSLHSLRSVSARSPQPARPQEPKRARREPT